MMPLVPAPHGLIADFRTGRIEPVIPAGTTSSTVRNVTGTGCVWVRVAWSRWRLMRRLGLV